MSTPLPEGLPAAERTSLPDAEQRLSDWVSVATKGLWEPAAALITRECREHTEQALTAGRTIEQALRELGDPRQAARAYRRQHLMAWQAPLIGPLLQGPEPERLASEMSSLSWWFKTRLVLVMVGVPVFISWTMMCVAYTMVLFFPPGGVRPMTAAVHAFDLSRFWGAMVAVRKAYLAASQNTVVLHAMAVSGGLGLLSLLTLLLLLRLWAQRAPLRLQSALARNMTAGCTAPIIFIPMIISTVFQNRSGWVSDIHLDGLRLLITVTVAIIALPLLYAVCLGRLYRRAGAFVG